MNGSKGAYFGTENVYLRDDIERPRVKVTSYLMNTNFEEWGCLTGLIINITQKMLF